MMRTRSSRIILMVGIVGGLLLVSAKSLASGSKQKTIGVGSSELGENWMEVGRGRNYLIYEDSVAGEHRQEIYPGPIHTWDGSEWVSYIFDNCCHFSKS